MHSHLSCGKPELDTADIRWALIHLFSFFFCFSSYYYSWQVLTQTDRPLQREESRECYK